MVGYVRTKQIDRNRHGNRGVDAAAGYAGRLRRQWERQRLRPSAQTGGGAGGLCRLSPLYQQKGNGEKPHSHPLQRGENNQFAFVYTLSADGETLYQSEKLQPGQKEEWDILRNCTESCTLDITITAWSLSDDKEQNSVTQTIDLTLPKRAQ